jgi:hypothetical protein
VSLSRFVTATRRSFGAEWISAYKAACGGVEGADLGRGGGDGIVDFGGGGGGGGGMEEEDGMGMTGEMPGDAGVYGYGAVAERERAGDGGTNISEVGGHAGGGCDGVGGRQVSGEGGHGC